MNEELEEVKKEEIIEAEKTEEVKEQVPEDNKKGLSIASMILGICSIVCCKSFIIAITCGILAIVFGLKGKKGAGKKMATAGFITGIIGLCLELVILIFATILVAAIFGAAASAV